MQETSVWPVLSLVAQKLDGGSLARAGCVSRACREVVAEDHLWEALCLQKWPSLSTPEGKHLLGLQQLPVGSFRHFYGLRAQAQAQHRRGRLRMYKQPSLQLQDVFFLIDISNRGNPVTSAVICSDQLLPSFVGECPADSSFEFSVPITCSSLSSRSWGKEEVQEFDVSWAVAARGSQRIHQMMNTLHQAAGQENRGVVVGNTCTYTQPLPVPMECACHIEAVLGPQGMLNESRAMEWHGSACEVQVKLECVCSRSVNTSPAGCTYQYSNFRPCRIGLALLHTKSWRCLKQAHALLYLQYALFHQCNDAI